MTVSVRRSIHHFFLQGVSRIFSRSKNNMNASYSADMEFQSHLRSIFCLNAVSWTWSTVGQLNSARSAHDIILVEDTFLVIGGMNAKPNEACLLKNGEFTCEITSYMNNYVNPILFLVNDTYGSC